MTDHIRPRIDRPAGSAHRRTQQRAITTWAAIVRVFATAFDTAGYAATHLNEVIKANSITKGFVYFHLLSKEADAQQLIEYCNAAVAQSVSDAAAAGGSIAEQLRTLFISLTEDIEEDQNIHAGFKLTLDPSIDGAHDSYRRWIETTSDLVEAGIRAGSISDTVMGRRLGWNLCSGFVGAVHSASILRGDLDLATRTSDMLSSYLPSAASHQTPRPMSARERARERGGSHRSRIRWAPRLGHRPREDSRQCAVVGDARLTRDRVSCDRRCPRNAADAVRGTDRTTGRRILPHSRSRGPGHRRNSILLTMSDRRV